MKLVSEKQFANGRVMCYTLADVWPIEVTSTFLPGYTKDAIGRRQNALTSADLGSYKDRWMIGVSTMSGCPVGCKFCATGQLRQWAPLTADEIVRQVARVVIDEGKRHGVSPNMAQEFKINYTRMGEPFMNLHEVRSAIRRISEAYPFTHHYVSTIGLKGSNFSWIEGNISLQISLHSLDEARRQELIPLNNLMSLEELGRIRTKSKLKTTLNLTLVDEKDFDIEKLKYYFDPEFFFIKLSPINPNVISEANGLGYGVIEADNLV